MPIKSVQCCSLAQAEDMEPRHHWAILSITDEADPGANLKEGWEHCLRVDFLDGELTPKLLNVAGYAAYRRMGFFTDHLAIKVREWLDDINRLPGDWNLVVHCHAGRNRSGAVAQYVADVFGARIDGGLRGCNKTVLEHLHDPFRYVPENERPVSPTRPKGIFERLRDLIR